MKDAWGWLVFAIAAIAAIFGASWGKRKLEERGAKKQHQKQLLEAARVEAELAASDAKIDAETEAAIRDIQEQQAERKKAEAEADKRSPTAEEIDRFIEESKS